MNNQNVLIVGASQGIGLGFVRQMLRDNNYRKVYAACRYPQNANLLVSLLEEYPERLTIVPMDITSESQILTSLEIIGQEISKLHLVINCVGLLHDENLQPEKSLRQINAENLLRYFQINSIGSVLLAKHLLPFFRHGQRSIFASISAKIGSIEDNKLGGWYGYRASKAALNMFMRTVAIEYSRKCPKNIVVMLHPGTTDTRLSRPFQKNVPSEKLFSVERSVNQLLNIINGLNETNSGQFFSWDGTQLPF